MKNFLCIMLLIFTLSNTYYVFSQGKTVEYKDGEAALKGYFAKASDKKSSTGKAPGVVIIHQWMGLTQHEKTSADKLAALGYHAFAADIYGSANMPATKEEAGREAGKYKSDYKLLQSRIKSAIDELVKLGADPDRIVVIGYCFGGTAALEAARAGLKVKGVVSFHGGLKKDTARVNGQIDAKVLVLHGADDASVSKADIDNFQKEMKDGKADWQMVWYANAVHAFTQREAGNDNSKGVAYNEKADKRSWEHLLVFLDEIFKEQTKNK